jgi:signal transduction histidine kinase
MSSPDYKGYRMFIPTDSTAPTQVLLVEDNAADAELIQDMLAEVDSTAFRCQVADRLSTALEQLGSAAVDVLLLDLSLPDSNGLDGLMKLLAWEPGVPIVVLTGFEGEALGIRAIRQGAQDYFVKGQVTGGRLARSLWYAIERKRSERRLAQFAATLEQNNRELHKLYSKVSTLEQLKTDMLRMASHDLLGLVNIVSGYLDMLRSDLWATLSDEQKVFFGQIESTSKRMEQLTRDILSVERIEAASSNQQETLDLRELVQLVFQHNQAQAEQKAQRYNLNTSPTTLMIEGDLPQIQEAITNLINNAIKYTPDQGAVEVRLRQVGSSAVFEVQDSGYGIPPEMQEHLFQEFFRAETKQTEHIDGTGLGLYLVKRVIERHQGQIYFHSVQSEGSIFGFRLPLVFAGST